MKTHSFFITVFTFFCGFLSSSQELPQITPLSPNAASIAKYGEVPVGYFTGVPNIGIPLYTIASGSLSLPLSLSYHAGGNKVESMASWVGLAWSLNTIPSISRSVRGLPDEGTGGFFNRYQGKTVREHSELDSNLDPFQYPSSNYRQELFHGQIDSEPDIFSYSILGESGKFFWDQESEEFITFPRSNIKIERVGFNYYRLTGTDGTEYDFDVTEETATAGATGSSPATSTWYASEIISANKQDIISLSYAQENQSYLTKTLVTKYQFLGGVGGSPPTGPTSINTNNTITAKVVTQINFKNGYVQFNRNTAERNDLSNSHSLNNISVYNNDDELINKYEFTYKYIGNCSGGDEESCWMLLDKLDNVSIDVANSERLSHNFFYDESDFPSSRTSAAQDYWGYHNGESSNINLIPTTSFTNPNNGQPIQINGANRSVNPFKSQFGIIQKIVYPTGGYTEFDFENNKANEEELPPPYIMDFQSLEGEGEIITTNYYEAFFTINNPSDSFLNAEAPNGGAFANFEVGFPGCDLSQGSNTCAIFRIRGQDANNSHINVYVTSTREVFLPNGNYKMSAEFNQDPQEYGEFYFTADWYKINENQQVINGNRDVGGLRVKEIRSYPNSTEQPIIKRYKYTTDYDSTISSGDVFSEPNFSYSDIYHYVNNDITASGVSTFLRLRSASNIQQVVQSGSSVGYKTVIEETENRNETGYTTYKFSHERDAISNQFPYAPGVSNELIRGQLLEQASYKKQGSEFTPIQKRILEYTNQPYLNSTSYPKLAFAIKWGNNLLNLNPSTATPNHAQVLELYEVEGDWSSLSKETVETYDGPETTTQITNYYYDNLDHLYQTRTETTDSDGSLTISKVKYPQDITNPSAGITALLNQNRLGLPIETETYKDNNNDGVANSNELLSQQKTNFRAWFTNVVFPENIQVKKINHDLENRILYYNYDDEGNPLELSQADGPPITYLWGYNKQYPIAKIENATFAQVASALGISEITLRTYNETNLGAINGLRQSLPNAMVSTYVYKPLVGVISMIDSRGYQMDYEYDIFNRLEYVKDQDGKILSKNEYNYKN